MAPGGWQVYAAVGRVDEVADNFAELLKPTTIHALDPFRSLPRFQALAADVERFFARVNGSAKPSSGPSGKRVTVPAAVRSGVDAARGARSAARA